MDTKIKNELKLFSGPIRFAYAVSRIDNLPSIGKSEVAFAGRSNVGKSSLINALFHRKALARTSSTPGRTQELIFFEVGEPSVGWVVDMPGYGYAAVSKTRLLAWSALIRAYLRGRPPLKKVFVLVDSRHGLKEIDRELFLLLDQSAVSYQVVLTKIDQISGLALKALEESITIEMKKHPAAFPSLLAVSSRNGTGLDSLREGILEAFR